MLIAALFAVAAQTTAPPPPAPARPIRWPAITEKKLGNGLTVVLVPLANVPKITAELTFLAGRGSDYREHPGAAQLAGRVLTEGTSTRTSRQLKEELRSIGGSMSVGVDDDATTITATSLSESAPKLLELLDDVAQHPAYPKAEVDLAKVNFASEIEEQRSNPDFVANEELEKAVFGRHPYGFVVPEPAAIAKITRESLRTFAASHYAPNNAHLIIVGDLEAGAMFDAVQKAFGGWKRGGSAPPLESPPLPRREKRQIYFVDRPGSVQSTIVMGAAAPPRKSPDYIALRTANMIFCGTFYSRLTRNIREDKGYTYSPFSVADLRRRAGAFWTSASVRNAVTGPTILEMLYELDRMRVAPVTKEELDSAKTYSLGTLSLELESQAGLANRINTIYTYQLPYDFLQTFHEKVDALTPVDIQKTAAKYFDTYRGAIVIVGDYAQVKDQIAPFGDVTLIKR
ncbi:MAG: insulinase family protein [Acidobacteriota bacterium]|nr:insulinase family protein [Acidobacteriota bacterium]